MITGRQIRDARTLLHWHRSALAKRSGLPVSVVHRAEADDGEANITLAQEIVLKHTFITAGVEFTPDGPRLRVSSPDPPPGSGPR